MMMTIMVLINKDNDDDYIRWKNSEYYSAENAQIEWSNFSRINKHFYYQGKIFSSDKNVLFAKLSVFQPFSQIFFF